jgi:hypothetical protein
MVPGTAPGHFETGGGGGGGDVGTPLGMARDEEQQQVWVRARA